MVIGNNKSGDLVIADDLGVGGALTVLMKDIINLTLMQILEETPIFVHACPFANIAHGNSSIVVDKIALKLVGPGGFVAGFGFGISTKNAWGRHAVLAGRPLDRAYLNQNVALVEADCVNLARHIINSKLYNANVIVVINKFSTNTDVELNAYQKACENARQSLKFLYPLDIGIKEKIEAITKSYGASGIEYSEQTKKKIEITTKQVDSIASQSKFVLIPSTSIDANINNKVCLLRTMLSLEELLRFEVFLFIVWDPRKSNVATII
ncbi:hypothetical protein RYX36_012594 [Vicia faba]